MVLPNECKDHCVYRVVGGTEDMYYCFGVGNFTAKCLERGHEECSFGPIAPAMTSKNKWYDDAIVSSSKELKSTLLG